MTTPARQPLQFSLKALFAAITLVAVATAVAVRSPGLAAMTALMAGLEAPLILAAIALSRAKDEGRLGCLTAIINAFVLTMAVYVGLAAGFLAIVSVADALSGGTLIR